MRRKYARGFDRLVYVLGADHHGYVARLQALAEMLGHPRDSLEVLLYQLVHLTRGGEATKMSKRRGDVVFLDEFVDEIGVDAARWYLVSRGHDQTIEIDVDLAAEQEPEEPRLLRPVRARADRRHAAERRGRRRPTASPAGPLAPEERDARQAAARASRGRPEATAAARAARDPDVRDPRGGRLPPLLPPAQGARLGRAGLPARALHRDEDGRRPCLDLLGVEAPERM